MKKTVLFAIPLTIFLVLALFLYQGLYSDSKHLDSMVTNQPIPKFTLPDLFEPQRLYDPEVFKGEVTLLNVWGVWCITCAVELPYLTELVAQENIRIVGLYYDQDLDPDFGTKTIAGVQQEVTQMLQRFGNPYVFQIFDIHRDLALDLGVTGAPEHFLIDKQGFVRWHHIGDINEHVWQEGLQPIIANMRSE